MWAVGLEKKNSFIIEKQKILFWSVLPVSSTLMVARDAKMYDRANNY